MNQDSPTIFTESGIALPQRHSAKKRGGIILGIIGVTAFSMTLVATRAAVPELGGTIVGLGRGVVASVIAATVLFIRREPIPARKYWPGLVIVGLGTAIGFPYFAALSLRHLPASHGAVLSGLLPAATAVAAVLRAHEHPRPIFWLGCVAGIISVLLFAAAEGNGRPQPADLLMLVAVASAAIAYAEGGRLGRELGGWRVISWALIIVGPPLSIPVLIALHHRGLQASPKAWLGFAYISTISMYAAFFPWYAALVRGGVARIGQIQLIQPVLTLIWSVLFLHEIVRPRTVFAAILVICTATVATVLGREQRAAGAAQI